LHSGGCVTCPHSVTFSGVWAWSEEEVTLGHSKGVDGGAVSNDQNLWMVLGEVT
jgi:hypothetical protein